MGVFDKIKKPLFYNESTSIQDDIDELKDIQTRVTGKNQDIIKQAIKNLEYGLKGEAAIKYELKNCGLPFIVITDLYLEFEDLNAQIDFLVITKDKIYVLECKNMYGDVMVEDSGDFIRKIGRTRQKIYSPITQLDRHLEVLKCIRSDSKNNILLKYFFEKNFENNYIPIVVMANPAGKINTRYAPKSMKKKIIGADQLNRFIKESYSEKDSYTENLMIKIADFYMSKNVKNPKNYMEQYRKLVEEEEKEIDLEKIDSTEDITENLTANQVEEVLTEEMTQPENVENDTVDEEKICPRCGGVLVHRVAKRGANAGNEFWGCSSYPKCRYIEQI